MIPTEIVDHVLGFLRSDEDDTTLRTCSVVFPQLVERHLYSYIALRDPPDCSFSDGSYVVNPARFSLTIMDSPHVARYVRSVHVHNPLALDLLVISSILPKLFQIKSITLSATRSSLPSWDVLHPGFRTAFQATLQLPSLKEAAIINISSFPLSLFDDCKNLKQLLLFSSCAGTEAVSTSSYPRLSSLSVGSQKGLTRMVSWMESNTLHSLSLRSDSVTALTDFRVLIKACASTLVNLELDCHFPGELCSLLQRNKVLDGDLVPSHLGYSTHPILPVLQLPLLERLIIRAVFMPLRRNYVFSIPLVAPLLVSISSMRPISLCIHLQRYYQKPFVGPGWSEVAALLLLPVFRHPIQMYFSAMFGTPLLSSFVSSLEENSDLKRLLETGNLVITHDRTASNLAVT